MVEHLAASGRATPVCPPDGPTAAPRLRSEHVDEDLVVRGELTGLLLRSAAVSGWTGLEVKAYAGADEKVDQASAPAHGTGSPPTSSASFAACRRPWTSRSRARASLFVAK